MIRIAIVIGAMLALAACADSGYYAPGIDLGLKGEIPCRIPANGHWTKTYVFTNTPQACRDVGGVPLK